jgi:hypothetical protein
VASSKWVRGAKAKGSGKTRELELNPADGSSHRRIKCHGYDSDEAGEEEEDEEDVVTRADLASEVVPLTS